jgi:capsular exopolysaccharide synthesis family protein
MTKIYEALENAKIEVFQGESKTYPSRPGATASSSTSSGSATEKEVRVYQALASIIPDSARRVIQFIGSREGEGTSTVVREFARVMAAKFGKSVLLLDADQHHPRQHLFFHLVAERGWQEVVRDNGPIEKALHQIGGTKLFVSPSSEFSPSHPHSYNSLLIDAFLTKLRQRFDLILIDSPPATTSTDGLALSAKVDGVVLVVEAEKTRWPVAENVRDRIKGSGGKILGIVLNKRRFHIPDFIYKRL